MSALAFPPVPTVVGDQHGTDLDHPLPRRAVQPLRIVVGDDTRVAGLPDDDPEPADLTQDDDIEDETFDGPPPSPVIARPSLSQAS